ncbi:MAG: hypothetical protein UGF45_12765 [Massilioclostridium sp.]|nr:hypothetical protein [Massilioclostridium sp.]MEE1492842.1 hypothetical protein [Massilioclostridium sp.]
MKKLFGCLILLGFLFLFGVVGAADVGAISIGSLLLLSSGCLAVILAGYFGFNICGNRGKHKRRTNVRAVGIVNNNRHCA